MYRYKDKPYPDYLKEGDACRFITPIAEQFCIGKGIDIGSSEWPFPGAEPWDITQGNDAYNLPYQTYDYVFSSHCLEHLKNPIMALKEWRYRIKSGGVLFLYLPHPDMEYWLPQNCYKHLHSWTPDQMVKIIKDLGFCDVMYSERDLNWSYSVVGFNN